ncbi:ammonium transporter [Pelosinus sp. IPA-1]|uniref:ammonium transporter n=1 Tax=Pelosinus sp. IPA-1 TaxID=3029569 RepID=UPI0024362107|nr:ammonium transporter [Pelosinus sp. IPA-1]GMB01429.1 ammonium transporter [Pelosinus sp. IPA-1]
MKQLIIRIGTYILFMMFTTTTAFAEASVSNEFPKIDTGDTAFLLTCAALVMLMTPGLALFYGGMVRAKNVLSIIMQSFFLIGLISVQWILFGYTLAFGPDINHLIGSFSWLGLATVGQVPNTDYAATVPHMAFMIFQAMFAIITPAVISGAFAERMKFPAFILFTLLWATFVYDPFAHWVWGTGGWLREMGLLDFAGGTVIEILSGISGLIIAIFIGKRKDYNTEVILPHHLPMTVLGASLLWFGWLGFNAGSAFGANGLAVHAFVTTHAAGAAATLTWVMTEWLYHGKPTVLGAVSGGIAGLVSITPAAGFVDVLPAAFIGGISGVLCFLSVSRLKAKFSYDDSLDVFGVHGIGGIWGTFATGLFASKAINPAGADGFFFGNPHQLTIQLIGIGASVLFAAAGTYMILKIISALAPIRVDADQESVGLDLTEHGERGYIYQDLTAGSPLAFSGNEDPAREMTNLNWGIWPPKP